MKSQKSQKRENIISLIRYKQAMLLRRVHLSVPYKKIVACLLIFTFGVTNLTYGLDKDTFDRIRARESGLRTRVEEYIGRPEEARETTGSSGVAPESRLAKEHEQDGGQYVPLRYGRRYCNVYYQKKGEGKTSVILLHGLGESGKCWNKVIDALAEKFTVYALDLPGFGRSDKPRTRYTLNQYVEMLDDFMEKQGISQAVLVGHSMGGSIAITFSNNYHNKIKKLVLVNSSGLPIMSLRVKLLRILYRIPVINLILYLIIKNIAASPIQFWRQVGRKVRKKVVPELCRQCRESSPRAVGQMLCEVVNLDLTDMLKNIKAPTLLIFGRDDPGRPPTMGEETKSLIPNSILKILNTGHYTPLEDPEGVATAILDFVSPASGDTQSEPFLSEQGSTETKERHIVEKSLSRHTSRQSGMLAAIFIVLTIVNWCFRDYYGDSIGGIGEILADSFIDIPLPIIFALLIHRLNLPARKVALISLTISIFFEILTPIFYNLFSFPEFLTRIGGGSFSWSDIGAIFIGGGIVYLCYKLIPDRQIRDVSQVKSESSVPESTTPADKEDHETTGSSGIAPEKVDKLEGVELRQKVRSDVEARDVEGLIRYAKKWSDQVPVIRDELKKLAAMDMDALGVLAEFNRKMLFISARKRLVKGIGLLLFVGLLSYATVRLVSNLSWKEPVEPYVPLKKEEVPIEKPSPGISEEEKRLRENCYRSLFNIAKHLYGLRRRTGELVAYGLDRDSLRRFYRLFNSIHFARYIRTLLKDQKLWIRKAYPISSRGHRMFMGYLGSLNQDDIIHLCQERINLHLKKGYPRFEGETLRKAAEENGLPVNLLVAVMMRETRDFLHYAKLKRDGRGLMQINRSTARLPEYWAELMRMGAVTGFPSNYWRLNKAQFKILMDAWNSAVDSHDFLKGKPKVKDKSDVAKYSKKKVPKAQKIDIYYFNSFKLEKLLFDPTTNVRLGAFILADAVKTIREIIAAELKKENEERKKDEKPPITRELADDDLYRFALAIYNRGESYTKRAVNLARKDKKDYTKFEEVRPWYRRPYTVYRWKGKGKKRVRIKVTRRVMPTRSDFNTMVNYIAYIYGGKNSRNEKRPGFHRPLHAITQIDPSLKQRLTPPEAETTGSSGVAPETEDKFTKFINDISASTGSSVLEVLDIGTCEGLFVVNAQSQPWAHKARFTCIDNDPEKIKAARALHQVKVQQMDWSNLGFDKERFDTVTFNYPRDVLLISVREAFMQGFKVCKRGGGIAFASTEDPRNGFPSRSMKVAVEEAGFTDVIIIPGNDIPKTYPETGTSKQLPAKNKYLILARKPLEALPSSSSLALDTETALGHTTNIGFIEPEDIVRAREEARRQAERHKKDPISIIADYLPHIYDLLYPLDLEGKTLEELADEKGYPLEELEIEVEEARAQLEESYGVRTLAEYLKQASPASPKSTSTEDGEDRETTGSSGVAPDSSKIARRIIRYLDDHDGWADKRELEECFNLSPEELEEYLSDIDFDILRTRRRKQGQPMPRVFDYGWKQRMERVIEALESMEGRGTLTDVGHYLGYRKEKVNSNTIFGDELNPEQIMDEINHRQRLKGRLILQIINARTKKRQDMIIIELEAIDGRGNTWELAILEEMLNVRKDRKRYPRSPLQNRAVGINEIINSMDFETLNYNRRLLGKPPFVIPVHREAKYNRTKYFEDLVLFSLEELGGWATVAQLESHSGVAREAVAAVVSRMDFDAINEWRRGRGLFPLGILDQPKRVWNGLKLSKLFTGIYKNGDLAEISREMRTHFRKKCGGEVNKLNIYEKIFKRFTLPFLYYCIYYDGNGYAASKDQVKLQRWHHMFQESITTVIEVAIDKRLSNRRLIDYFRYVVPRAINISRSSLDPHTITSSDYASIFRTTKKRQDVFRSNIYRALLQQSGNTVTHPLATSIYKISEEANAEEALVRLKSSGKDKILRKLMRSSHKTPSEDRETTGSSGVAPEDGARKLGEELAEQIDVELYEKEIRPILQLPSDQVYDRLLELEQSGKLEKALPFIKIMKERPRYKEGISIYQHSRETLGYAHGLASGTLKSFYEDYDGWRLDPETAQSYQRLLSKSTDRDRELLNLAVLLHDIGILVQSEEHPKIGAILASKILERLGLTVEEILLVTWLVDHHVDLSTLLSGERRILWKALEELSMTLRGRAMRFLALLTIGESRTVYEPERDRGRFVERRNATFYLDATDPERLSQLKKNFGRHRLERFSAMGSDAADVDQEKHSRVLEIIERHLPESEKKQFWFVLDEAIEIFDYANIFFQALNADALVKILYLFSQIEKGYDNKLPDVILNVPTSDAPKAAKAVQEILRDYDFTALTAGSLEFSQIIERLGITVDEQSRQIKFDNRRFVQSHEGTETTGSSGLTPESSPTSPADKVEWLLVDPGNKRQIESLLRDREIRDMMRVSLGEEEKIYFFQTTDEEVAMKAITEELARDLSILCGISVEKGFLVTIDVDWDKRTEKENRAYLSHEVGHIALDKSGRIPLDKQEKLRKRIEAYEKAIDDYEHYCDTFRQRLFDCEVVKYQFEQGWTQSARDYLGHAYTLGIHPDTEPDKRSVVTQYSLAYFSAPLAFEKIDPENIYKVRDRLAKSFGLDALDLFYAHNAIDNYITPMLEDGTWIEPDVFLDSFTKFTVRIAEVFGPQPDDGDTETTGSSGLTPDSDIPANLYRFTSLEEIARKNPQAVSPEEMDALWVIQSKRRILLEEKVSALTEEMDTNRAVYNSLIHFIKTEISYNKFEDSMVRGYPQLSTLIKEELLPLAQVIKDVYGLHDEVLAKSERLDPSNWAPRAESILSLRDASIYAVFDPFTGDFVDFNPGLTGHAGGNLRFRGDTEEYPYQYLRLLIFRPYGELATIKIGLHTSSDLDAMTLLAQYEQAAKRLIAMGFSPDTPITIREIQPPKLVSDVVNACETLEELKSKIVDIAIEKGLLLSDNQTEATDEDLDTKDEEPKRYPFKVPGIRPYGVSNVNTFVVGRSPQALEEGGALQCNYLFAYSPSTKIPSAKVGAIAHVNLQDLDTFTEDDAATWVTAGIEDMEEKLAEEGADPQNLQFIAVRRVLFEDEEEDEHLTQLAAFSMRNHNLLVKALSKLECVFSVATIHTDDVKFTLEDGRIFDGLGQEVAHFEEESETTGSSGAAPESGDDEESKEPAEDKSEKMKPGGVIVGPLDSETSGGRGITNGSISKAMLHLGLPTAFGSFMFGMFKISEMLFVGPLGAVAISALHMCERALLLFSPAVSSIDISAKSLVSRYWGKGKKYEARKVIGQTIVLCASIALVMIVALNIGGGLFLQLLNASPKVTSIAMPFIKLFSIAQGLRFVAWPLRTSIHAAGFAKESTGITTLFTMTNIVLLPIFISGTIFEISVLPIAYGFIGVAVASLIARSIDLISSLYVVFTKLGISTSDLRPDFNIVKDIYRLGKHPFKQTLSESLSGFILTTLIGTFGTAAVAGYAIASRFSIVPVMVACAFAFIASTAVGQNVGDGQTSRAKKFGWISVILFGAVMLSIGVPLIYIYASDIISFFSSIPAVISVGAKYLLFLPWDVLFWGGGFILSFGLSASGDTRTPFIISFVTLLLVRIAACGLLGFGWGLGLTGLWWGIVGSSLAYLGANIYSFHKSKLESEDLREMRSDQESTTPSEEEGRETTGSSGIAPAYQSEEETEARGTLIVGDELARLLHEGFRKAAEAIGRPAIDKPPIFLLTGDVLNPVRNALDRSGFFRMFLGSASEAALGDLATAAAEKLGLGVAAVTFNVGSLPALSRFTQPLTDAQPTILISGAPALKGRGFWRRLFGSFYSMQAPWHMTTDEDARRPDYEADLRMAKALGFESIEVGRWRWYAWLSGPFLLLYGLRVLFPGLSSRLPAWLLRLSALFVPTPAEQMRRAIELAVVERRPVFLKVPVDVASWQTLTSTETLVKPNQFLQRYFLKFADWIGETLKDLMEGAIDVIWDLSEWIVDILWNHEKRARSIVRNMKESDRPIIYAGSKLSRDPEIVKLLQDFSKITGIPIANSWSAKGLFDGRFENSIGTYIGRTTPWEGTRKYIEEEADFILRLGDPLVPFMQESGAGTYFPRGIKAKVRRFRGRRYFRQGQDLRRLIEAMIKEAERQGLTKEEGFKKRFDRKALGLPELPEKTEIDALKEKKVTRKDLARVLEWVANEIETAEPESEWKKEEVHMEVAPSTFWFLAQRMLRRIFSDWRRADIGSAAGRAAGTAIADPTKFVVTVTGDGGFVAHGWSIIQDLAKRKTDKTRMATIVLDDNSYLLGTDADALSPEAQEALTILRGDRVKYEEVAKGLGLQAFRAETNEELIKALKSAQEYEGPTLIVVPMEHDKERHREIMELKRLVTEYINPQQEIRDSPKGTTPIEEEDREATGSSGVVPEPEDDSALTDVERITLLDADDFIDDFEDWLAANGGIEWDGGPRYGMVKGVIRYAEKGESLVERPTCQVYPVEEWKLSFPELQKLEYARDGFYPDAGTFGQIYINWYHTDSGHTTIFIEEIQPNDGYRRLTHAQRRRLDAWRRMTIDKVIEYAESRNFMVFGCTPELIEKVNKKLKPYEIDKNYIEPFSDSAVWTRQDLIIDNYLLSQGIFSTYPQYPKGVISCYAYRGNAAIIKRLEEKIPVYLGTASLEKTGIVPESTILFEEGRETTGSSGVAPEVEDHTQEQTFSEIKQFIEVIDPRLHKLLKQKLQSRDGHLGYPYVCQTASYILAEVLKERFGKDYGLDIGGIAPNRIDCVQTETVDGDDQGVLILVLNGEDYALIDVMHGLIEEEYKWRTLILKFSDYATEKKAYKSHGIIYVDEDGRREFSGIHGGIALWCWEESWKIVKELSIREGDREATGSSGVVPEAEANMILSQDIEESWEVLWAKEGTGALMVSQFYANSEHIGRATVHIRNQGVSLDLCGFESKNTGRRLAAELLARAYLRGKYAGNLLNLNPRWAYAYYDLSNYEKPSDFKFPKALAKALDRLGMKSYLGYNLEQLDKDLTFLLSSPHLENLGQYAVEMEELLNNLRENWIDWFYRRRLMAVMSDSAEFSSAWDRLETNIDTAKIDAILHNEDKTAKELELAFKEARETTGSSGVAPESNDDSVLPGPASPEGDERQRFYRNVILETERLLIDYAYGCRRFSIYLLDVLIAKGVEAWVVRKSGFMEDGYGEHYFIVTGDGYILDGYHPDAIIGIDRSTGKTIMVRDFLEEGEEILVARVDSEVARTFYLNPNVGKNEPITEEAPPAKPKEEDHETTGSSELAPADRGKGRKALVRMLRGKVSELRSNLDAGIKIFARKVKAENIETTPSIEKLLITPMEGIISKIVQINDIIADSDYIPPTLTQRYSSLVDSLIREIKDLFNSYFAHTETYGANVAERRYSSIIKLFEEELNNIEGLVRRYQRYGTYKRRSRRVKRRPSATRLTPKKGRETTGSSGVTPEDESAKEPKETYTERVNNILAVLPSDKVEEPQEMAEYIAVRFGDRWVEVLSLTGWNLMDRERRPFIEQMLESGVSILRLADLLNYADYLDLGVTIETFPVPFQNLILESAESSRRLVTGPDIDALWAVYSTARPHWIQGIEGQKERIEALEELRREMIVWADNEGMGLFPKSGEETIDQWDDDRLVRKTLKAARAFWRPRTYLTHVSNQTRVEDNIVRVNISNDLFEFSNGLIKQGQFEGQLAFNVWLTEPGLLRQLTEAIPDLAERITYVPLFEKEALHVSSIVYTEVRDSLVPTVLLPLFQTCIRLSSRQPLALRERIGSIDELTERAFRAYASEQNITRILAPSGSQIYLETVDPVHAKTVERINNIFRKAAYRLVFYEGNWRWQFDFEQAGTIPESATPPEEEDHGTTGSSGIAPAPQDTETVITQEMAQDMFIYDVGMLLRLKEKLLKLKKGTPELIAGKEFQLTVDKAWKDDYPKQYDMVVEWWKALKVIFKDYAGFRDKIIENASGKNGLIKITCKKIGERTNGQEQASSVDVTGTHDIGPRIFRLLNMAFAASNIPHITKDEGIADFHPLIDFINDQYFLLTGIRNYIDISSYSPDTIKRKIRTIKIYLEPIRRIDYEKELEVDMAIETLRAV